jgi:uncharacterized membrane protein
MTDALREVVLIAATMAMGLMAEVFGMYGNAIMPGLRRTDDRTFVAAFQLIGRSSIPRSWRHSSERWRSLLWPRCFISPPMDAQCCPGSLQHLFLDLFVFVITIGVNVPRNNEIKAAGNVERITDPHVVRERFDEAKWARWNHLRTFASTVAFGLLAWALVQSGQTL